MRLTLRTLLAYLDEILEPKDTQEIGKKIEESEVAGSLLHRIRDVMRRLRLKAPEIDEQDTALDSNTVAEYLDNTLPDDQVPDFEKVCLESDVHLAEVAACHQILAMVLGEPAEIDPKSRAHMYTLRQVSAEQNEMEAAVANGFDSDAPSPKPSRPRRPRPEIPEYLRKRPKRKRWLSTGPALTATALTATVLAVAGCLVAVLLAATGQLGFLGINPPLADDQLAAKHSDDGPAPDDANVAEQQTPDEAPPDDKQTDTDQPDAVDEPVVTERPPAVSAVVSTVQQPDAAPVQTPDGLVQPLSPLRPDDANHQPTTRPLEKPPVEKPPVEKQPADQPPPADAVAEKQPKPDESAAAPPVAPVPPERIGRFISDNDVLLRLTAAEKDWTRVPARDILTSQYDLLSLPTFRPTINTTTGLTLRLVDGTRIAFEPPDAEGVAGLKIAYGRVIVFVQTVGKAQASLALKLGSGAAGLKSGLLTFGDAESTLTIEVSRQLDTGRNPEDQSARLKAVFCVVSGRVQWAEEGAEPVEIDALQKLTLGGTATEKPVAMPSSPDWIIADSVSLLDQKASATVEAELNTERPVSLGLKELAGHRKKEVRRLAIRCLGHIGRFDQMAAVLNDHGQRLARVRPDYINDLRASLARGPEVAAHVRQAFQRQYGPDAPALFRLLWGFTDEQLGANDELLGSGNADEMLIDFLDHKLLAFRVLGFWNLQTITGMGLYYQPEEIVNKRQQSIRKWRQRLNSGEIRRQKKPSAAKGKK